MYFKEAFLNKFAKLMVLFVLVLILLDLVTFFFYPDTFFADIFRATREQTPLTWVTSVTFLVIGLIAASNYLEFGIKKWAFISIVFLFFSIDDATYFHERFSGGIQHIFPILFNFPSYSWMILYVPIGLSAIFLLIFDLYEKNSLNYKKALCGSVFVLFVALFLDFVDGLVVNDNTLYFCYSEACNIIITHILRLMEEVLEFVGLGIIAYVTAKKYAQIK